MNRNTFSVRHSLFWVLFFAFGLLSFISFQLTPLLSSPDHQETGQARVILQEGLMNIGIPMPFLSQEVSERIGIDTWREAGWMGRNQRIGVIDHGFGGLGIFQATFGVSVTTRHNIQSYDTNLIRHGTDALQIIHSIAPSAVLYACQYATFPEFDDCVGWMETEVGVRIIEHSGGVPWLAANGNNPWVERAARAANNGILWVNAAGDYARGALPVNYTNIGNGAHRFHFTDEPEWIDIAPLVDGQFVALTWQSSSTVPANQIDFQIVLEYADDNALYSSEQPQRGEEGDLPLDWIYVEQGRPFRVQIRTESNVPDGLPLLLFVPFTDLPQSDTNRSVISPSDSDAVLTVGALQGADIAPYSGRGLSVFGSIKPDLVAPGEIYLLGNRLFYGTITAASVVTGATALVWEANPLLSQQEILEFFRTDALFTGESRGRPNLAFGGGYLALRPPVSTPTPTLVSSLTPTSTGLPTETPNPQFRLAPAQDFPVARVVAESAYLREGPGVNFQAVGSAFRDDQFAVTGRQFDWYQVRYPNSSLLWIASSVVEVLPENVSIRNVEQPPTEPPTQIPPATPTFFPRTPPHTPAPPQIENVVIIVRTVIVTATPTPSLLLEVTTIAPSRSHVSTSTSTPSTTVTPITGCIPSAQTGFAVLAQSIEPVNVRSQPSTSASAAMQLMCNGTRFIAFSQSVTCANNEIWYGNGASWVRSDVVRVAGTQNEAVQEAERICAIAQPTTQAPPPGTTTVPPSPGATTPGPTQTPPPPPPPSISVISVGPPGSGAGGGCYAPAAINGPNDINGRVCIQNNDVLDCNYTFNGPSVVGLEFGGIGQPHHIWMESNYGSADGGTHTCS